MVTHLDITLEDLEKAGLIESYRKEHLVLYPIEVEDFILEYKDFEPEAVEQIYAATKGDMRKFEEIVTDCRERARELKYVFVEVNLELSFLAEQPGV